MKWKWHISTDSNHSVKLSSKSCHCTNFIFFLSYANHHLFHHDIFILYNSFPQLLLDDSAKDLCWTRLWSIFVYWQWIRGRISSTELFSICQFIDFVFRAFTVLDQPHLFHCLYLYCLISLPVMYKASCIALTCMKGAIQIRLVCLYACLLEWLIHLVSSTNSSRVALCLLNV